MNDQTPSTEMTPTPITTGTTKTEEFKLSGEDILAKMKDLLHEGNVRRIIVKDAGGRIIAEFPLTAGVIGALLVPTLAAIGAIAALASDMTIVVERKD